MDEFGDDVREAQQENAAEDEESDEQLDGESDEQSDEQSDEEFGKFQFVEGCVCEAKEENAAEDQESDKVKRERKAKAVVLEQLKWQRSSDKLANALSLLTSLS
jgi:hypothetical protein